MKQIFFTPGPSQLYPTIPAHIQTALEKNILSISHRSEAFQVLFHETRAGLQELLGIPKEYYIVFVSSGTEAMERIIQNTVEKRSFHFVNGSFGKRWFDTALELQKTPEIHEVLFGKGFTTIPRIPNDTELLCFTHNETSSGVAIDPAYIYHIAAAHPHALIALDTVSSSPYVDVDYCKLDCVFFSVQKLFGLPAGLGVIILSPKALQKAAALQRKGFSLGTYHNFLTMVQFAEKNHTVETPNVFGMYLLHAVIKDFLKKGIQTIRKEIEEKAAFMYDFFDNNPEYTPFVTEKKDRSQTVIVVTCGEKTKKIQNILKEKGFLVGGGYGPYKETQLRIANFPATEKKDIEKLLEVFSYV